MAPLIKYISYIWTLVRNINMFSLYFSIIIHIYQNINIEFILFTNGSILFPNIEIQRWTPDGWKILISQEWTYRKSNHPVIFSPLRQRQEKKNSARKISLKTDKAKFLLITGRNWKSFHVQYLFSDVFLYWAAAPGFLLQISEIISSRRKIYIFLSLNNFVRRRRSKIYTE